MKPNEPGSVWVQTPIVTTLTVGMALCRFWGGKAMETDFGKFKQKGIDCKHIKDSQNL